MASWGKCDFRELKELNERIKKAASPQQMDQFYTDLLDDMVNGLQKAVIQRTPPGPTKLLKRSWFRTKAVCSGKVYRAKIYNNVEYAPWVENGHRQQPGRYVKAIGKRLVKPWVEGKFMLRDSLFDYQKQAPEHIKTKSKQFLREMMGDGST